jgi:hypothetical protein
MKKCFEQPNKNRYNTEKDAETAILMSSVDWQIELRSYHCDACDGWHLTSKNRE